MTRPISPEELSIEAVQGAICSNTMDLIADIVTSAQVRMMLYKDPVHQEKLISLAQASSRRVAVANNCAAILFRNDDGELFASCNAGACHLSDAIVG